MTIPKKLTLLQQARALLAEPTAWCHDTYARDGDGEAVLPYESTAVAWCAIGAIVRFQEFHGRTRLAASKVLNRAAFLIAGTLVTSHYNDHPGRTHADILALYDRAIMLADGQTAQKEQEHA
jgi:hypothetical protein